MRLLTIPICSTRRPTGALNVFHALAPGTTDAEGCCICESGCDHTLETPSNGDCGEFEFYADS